jgi:hypothetical protein
MSTNVARVLVCVSRRWAPSTRSSTSTSKPWSTRVPSTSPETWVTSCHLTASVCLSLGRLHEW